MDFRYINIFCIESLCRLYSYSLVCHIIPSLMWTYVSFIQLLIEKSKASSFKKEQKKEYLSSVFCSHLDQGFALYLVPIVNETFGTLIS